MLPLANSEPRGAKVPVMVLGNPESRRVHLLQHALERLEQPPAKVIPYGAFLSGQITLPEVVTPGAVVRIESPDRDFEVQKSILELGLDVPDDTEYECISSEQLRDLPFERGRLLYPRQWYRGFCRLLLQVEQQLKSCPPHRLMNSPHDVGCMFDKSLCHDRLQAGGIPVPRSTGCIHSYEQLIQKMEETGLHAVFVKIAHGSSAAGVVAFKRQADRCYATTTVEMVWKENELCLYNTRQIQVLRDERCIARLVDALCRHQVHVEQWLPKAGLEGYCFDLRVVIIGGQARHAVARLSQTPMTNLHLLNSRRPIEAVVGRIGVDTWQKAQTTCEMAMQLFPNSFYAGVDLVITSDYRSHAVVEVNAFGDLLPGVEWQGMDTYTAEMQSLLMSCPDDRPS